MPKRFFHPAAVFAATALQSSMAVAATPAEDLVRSWLTANTAGLPVQIGASSFDPATQSVELENVVIGDPNGAIAGTFGRLTFQDPRRTLDGEFAAHAIRGSEMTWTFRFDPAVWLPEDPDEPQGADEGTGGAAAAGEPVPGATAPDGQPAPAADAAAAAAEEKKPFDMILAAETLLIERPVAAMSYAASDPNDTLTGKIVNGLRLVEGVRIDWAELNGVSFETKGMPGGDSRTTYGLYYLSGMHDGRIERFGLGDMTQTMAVEGAEAETYIDSGYASGIDLKATREVLDPASSPGGTGDGRWRVVMEQAGYNGLRIAAPEAGITVGNVEMNGFRMRPVGRPVLEVYAQLLTDPEAIESDPVSFFRESIPSLTGLYGLDTMSMSDFEVTTTENVSFRLPRLDINRIDNAGIGSIAFRDMSVDAGEAGSGKLDLLAFNNIRFGSFARLLELGLAADAAGEDPPPGVVRDIVLEFPPRLDFFELSGLMVETPTGTVALDAFAQTGSRHLKQQPRRVDTTFTRLSFPVAMIPDPEARKPLEDMGYEQISVSGAMTAEWKTDRGEAVFEDFTLQVEEMGALSLDLRLGNIPLSILDDPEMIEQRMTEATIVEANLVFGNQSIVERGFAFQGKQLNQDGEQFRKNFAGGIPFMLGFVGDPEIQKRMAEPLRAFIDDPKSLRISLKPKAPLPIKMLDGLEASPGEVLKLLGLEMTANQ